MGGRVLALLRARLAAQPEGRALPVSALVLQALIASVLCGLVRDLLPPFAYGIFALTLTGALVALPLLGEFASLLGPDEADEWVRSLPATDIEQRLARMAQLLIGLATLTLGAALPAAAFGELGLLGRAALLAAAFGQTLVIAAALLAVQAAWRGRAAAPLVIVQMALFLAVIGGSTVGLRHVVELSGWSGPADAPGGLAWFPPAWFAAPLSGSAAPAAWLWSGPIAAAAAAALLALLPAPARPLQRAGMPLLSRLLEPVRRLALRVWVAPEERAAFQLVFDGLPVERAFVLRTYPLIAVPLAFLLVDRAMLPLLVFTPGAWLPILLMHVPTSASHEARWLVDTAPAAPHALAGGAQKAVVVRFVLPLYLWIGLAVAAVGGASLALRMVPIGFLAALLVVRLVWRRCVEAAPLSIAPEALRVDLNRLFSLLGTLAIGLTLAALGAVALLERPLAAPGACAALLLAEVLLDRRQRSGKLQRAGAG
jgi:hypothetical protein